VHDSAADRVGGLERWQIGGVMADVLAAEALGGGDAGWLQGEVGGGAQDEHALDIGAAGAGEVGQGAERAGVLHRGGHEVAAALGVVGDPVVGPFVE
jgi:hypothetical protein